MVIARDKTMKQMTLATVKGFEKHERTTRKAEFLARMDGLMPWAEFCALIEPHYLNPLLDPKAVNGWPPVGVARMLRMYCVANWFNLSDEACENLNTYLNSHQVSNLLLAFMVTAPTERLVQSFP